MQEFCPLAYRLSRLAPVWSARQWQAAIADVDDDILSDVDSLTDSQIKSALNSRCDLLTCWENLCASFC